MTFHLMFLLPTYASICLLWSMPKTQWFLFYCISISWTDINANISPLTPSFLSHAICLPHLSCEFPYNMVILSFHPPLLNVYLYCNFCTAQSTLNKNILFLWASFEEVESHTIQCVLIFNVFQGMAIKRQIHEWWSKGKLVTQLQDALSSQTFFISLNICKISP